MTTILRSIKKSACISRMFMLAVLSMVSVAANAQLSGNYTIDTTAAASTTNFKSFGSFRDKLVQSGVSGAVVVKVLNGPYTEQVDIPQISTMSSTKTVTINGNLQTLKFSSSSNTARYTLRLNGADYFTFDSLNIRAEGSSYAVGVHLKNNADYNTFKNCIIECPKVQSSLGWYYNIYNNISAIVMINNSDYQGSFDYYYGSTYVTDQSGYNGAYNTFTNNTLNGADNNSVSGPMFGIFETGIANYWSYNSYVQNNTFSNNKIKNIYASGITSIYTNGTQITGNTVTRDIYWSNSNSSSCYAINTSFCGSSNRQVLVEGNTVTQFQGPNTSSIPGYYYPYQFYAMYSFESYPSGFGKKVNANLVYNNESGYVHYGSYNYQMGGSDLFTNNIYYNNLAYGYMYGEMNYYPSGGEISHNTHIVPSNSIGSKTYNFWANYGFYIYHYTNNSCRVRANNVYIATSQGSAYPMYLESTTSQYLSDFSDNNGWWSGSTTPYYDNYSFVNAANFNASLTKGKNNTDLKSKFADLTNMDFRLFTFALNNKVPYNANISKDQKGAQRNKTFTDVGSIETPTDIRTDAISSTLPANICSGYSYKPTVKITNLFADTIFNFRITARAGNQTAINEIVSTKVAPNASLTYTFTTPVTFNVPGNITLWAGNNMPDDNTLNDTLRQTTAVKPSPTGGKLQASSNATKALYQPGKTFDITIVGEPVYYDVLPPKSYPSAADFSSKWSSNTWVETEVGGTVLGTSDVAITQQSSASTPIKVLLTSTAYEDKYLIIKTRITDIINGCDTLIQRRLLQYPKIVPKFTGPTLVCNGSDALFTSTSTVKSGAIEYHWDFGTGNPADLSEAPAPVFLFPGPGSYKVKMTAKTLPYGFESYDSMNVTVNPIPTVKFTKLNACEGKAVTFTNQTTPTNSTYVWNFGAGQGTSTLTNPSKTYSTPGAYTVTLTATLNGCSSVATQRVYQFNKPAAKYALVSGTCENDVFKFQDQSTIVGGGNIGRKWDFNDNGALSTDEMPEHKFSGDGVKQVKMVSISEFGCMDSVTKAITVKPAPEIDFTNTDACSNTPTIFTNNTPTVAGTNAIFNWSFGDGATSATESPTHSWLVLGPKTVNFTINLDNGCSASMSKDLNVGVQPVANFKAMDVCAGQPVVFDNQTSWPQGDVTYEWDFGGIGNSTNSDPQFTFNNTTTRTWQVTLKASIAGGCSDQITKPINVYENPSTCDFDPFFAYERGHRGINLRPKNGAGKYGVQSGIDYTFVYGNEGSGKDTFHDFATYGKFMVTMRAKNSNGCECTVTKEVSILANTKDFSKFGIKMYPNPNTGNFQINTGENFGKSVRVELLTLTGQVVKAMDRNGGVINVNATDLSSGMYMVRLTSGANTATSRIQINN